MRTAKKSRSAAADDFLANHPWFAQQDNPDKKRKVDIDEKGDAGAASGDDSDSQASAGGTGSDNESDDLVVDEVFAELQAARDKWHLDHGHQGVDDFGGGLKGGFFTRRTFGDVTDFAACEATSADAARFVQLYGLQASKRCKLLRYGSDTASLLVLGWAHNMQYFLDLYRASGDRNYVFTAADHDTYREPDYFLIWQMVV